MATHPLRQPSFLSDSDEDLVNEVYRCYVGEFAVDQTSKLLGTGWIVSRHSGYNIYSTRHRGLNPSLF